MAYRASLRETLLSNELPPTTSIRELCRRHEVNSARELIARLTPDWHLISELFTEDDRLHMLYGTEESGPLAHPMDLADLEDVRRNADAIYERVTTENEALRMPPYPLPRWPLDLVLYFRRWMAGGMRA